MPKSIEELQAIARKIRREIVVMIGAAKSGHPGGSLSAVEILVELYFNRMHIDPKNPTCRIATGSFFPKDMPRRCCTP
jgi:transketolase